MLRTRLSKSIAALAVATAGFVAPTAPTLAASQVVVSAGPVKLPLAVADIESYVTTGQASTDLQPVVRLLKPDQAKAFRDVMSTPLNVKPQPFGQFLRSTLGQEFLGELSTAIKPTNGTAASSTQFLQTAMTGAASDGTLTLLEVIKQYPADQVMLDQQAVQSKFTQLQNRGKDLQLLLASFGINVDLSNANPAALVGLVSAAETYVGDVSAFVDKTGITQAELTGATPPTGTVTVQKADLYQLYQKLNRLTQRVVDESGVEVNINPPR